MRTNLVVSESCHLDLDTLVLNSLWGGVVLLLTFLATSSQSEDQMESGLFLNVVVAQCATIFQLLTSKDKTLLIWGDS